MKLVVFLAACLAGALSASATEPEDAAKAQEVRQRLEEYLDAFNTNDPQAVASYWAENAVSVDEETGQKVVGRSALLTRFESFFQAYPGAKLTGQVVDLRLLGGDVAIAEGDVTLFTPGEEPTPSAFTAVLVQEAGEWLIESSTEREPPSPPTSAVALQELAWLVGDWRDETEGVAVQTTVRWSANQAFLIRSFRADYDAGEVFEGTQIIGWDPLAKRYRTWVFNSDGSFGEGTVSLGEGECVIKMSHLLSEGRSSTATQIISLIDKKTIRVEKTGHTIDGIPVPTSDPITVVRVEAAVTTSQVEGATP